MGNIQYAEFGLGGMDTPDRRFEASIPEEDAFNYSWST